MMDGPTTDDGESQARRGPLQPGEPSPPPTRLPKPRIVVTRPVAVVVSAGGAEPVGSRLELDTLLPNRMAMAALRDSQPASVLRELLLDADVLRQVVICLVSPLESELLVNAASMTDEQRDIVAKKMAFIACELLLETSPRVAQAYRLLMDQQMLCELWKFVERPAPADAQTAGFFKQLVDRLLRRMRDRTLVWLATPWLEAPVVAADDGGTAVSGSSQTIPKLTSEGLSARAEAIRSMPVFRLFRHLDSEHVAALLSLALEKEAEATTNEDKGGGGGGGGAAARPPGAKPPTRWSNKFDLVRVLVHKMRVGVLDNMEDSERLAVEHTATHASMLLLEVLKHSSTHVDLLKNVLQSAKQYFDVALGVSGESFHPLQFAAAWPVLMELGRALGRIWLPQRQTRLITDSIQAFVAALPVLRETFVAPPDVAVVGDGPGLRLPRLGFVRLAIAELVSMLLSGRLVSLFAKPLGDSGLLTAVLDMCWEFPNASIYHHAVFVEGLIPMVRNCLASDANDDVFAPAAPAVVELLQSTRVWERLIASHFSYEASTEPLRNKYAHNGYLTQLANALVASTMPVAPDVMAFVADRLDWTNSVETSPITSCVFSNRMDGIAPPAPGASSQGAAASDSESTEGDSDDDDDGDGDGDSDDEPQPVQLSAVRTLPKSRVELLARNPVPSQYESPPRPRLPMLDPVDASDTAAAAAAVAAGAATGDESGSDGYQSGDEAEAGVLTEEDTAAHNEFEYWRLPVMSIELQ